LNSKFLIGRALICVTHKHQVHSTCDWQEWFCCASLHHWRECKALSTTLLFSLRMHRLASFMSFLNRFVFILDFCCWFWFVYLEWFFFSFWFGYVSLWLQ